MEKRLINNNMKLKEEISDNDLDERIKLEKIISSFVKSRLGQTIKNDNFYDVVVDIYNSDYGKHCHVTFLMKKPFGAEYSNDIHTVFRGIKSQMGDFFPSFTGGLTNSTETIESYLKGKYWYDEKKESLNENQKMKKPNELDETQLRVFNKVLNKKLSQNFPWWFEGIEIFRAGFNHGHKNLYMDGDIYVDADWIGTQWRNYYDNKPQAQPEFGTDNDEYTFSDLIGMDDPWIEKLKEIVLSVFNSIHGGDYPKYLSFSWLNVKPVETKKDMKGNNSLKEHIKKVIQEEVNKKYLKPSEKTEKIILDRLNKIFSDMNMYHTKSYETRHDIEFCKNGKEMMNLVLYFEDDDDDDMTTSERKFIESNLFIPKEFVNGILDFIPIRKNYLIYLIEEWFEDNFLNDIINKIGRNDISVDKLSLTDNVNVCVPPVTEKPEGVTVDDMIEVIMKNTLWRKKDLLNLGPDYIEDMYLTKLRNNEIDRLSNE